MPTLTQTRIDKYGKPIWMLTLYDGSGKRTVHTFHGSRKEALIWRDKMMYAQSQQTRENITLNDYAEKWLKQKKEELKHSTWRHYEIHLTKHILPEIGKVKISALNPDHIKKVLARVEDEGVTGATQLRYFRTITSMLQSAVYDGYIEINVARQVKPPRQKRSESQFYEKELITAILKELPKADLSIRVPLTIAICTGMRRGEIIALKWDDIDLTNKIINVGFSVDYIDGKQTRTAPKTAKSARTIPMPQLLAKLLTSARKARKTDYVCEWRGEWLKYYFLDDLLTRFLDSLKVGEDAPKIFKEMPKISFHKIRHTAASIMIQNGTGVVDLAELLGHSQRSTTLNIYSHSFKKSQSQAVKIFDEMAK
jgi:integrase